MATQHHYHPLLLPCIGSKGMPQRGLSWLFLLLKWPFLLDILRARIALEPFVLFLLSLSLLDELGLLASRFGAERFAHGTHYS